MLCAKILTPLFFLTSSACSQRDIDPGLPSLPGRCANTGTPLDGGSDAEAIASFFEPVKRFDATLEALVEAHQGQLTQRLVRSGPAPEGVGSSQVPTDLALDLSDARFAAAWRSRGNHCDVPTVRLSMYDVRLEGGTYTQSGMLQWYFEQTDSGVRADTFVWNANAMPAPDTGAAFELSNKLYPRLARAPRFTWSDTWLPEATAPPDAARYSLLGAISNSLPTPAATYVPGTP